MIRLLNSVLVDECAGLEVRRIKNRTLEDYKDLELQHTPKGLFATQSYKKGDIVWTEPPLLSTHTFACPLPACRHCLRALASRQSTQAVIECPGSCGHRYCSDECRSRAHLWYHSWVCSCEEGCPSRGERLSEFEDFARAAGNEYYVMAAQGLAMAAASLAPLEDEDEDLDTTLAEHMRCWFGQFEQCTWWQTIGNPGKSFCVARMAVHVSYSTM
jgi:hypothetical protein